MKYSTWIIWFSVSVSMFLLLLMIMTFPNTKPVKELPYLLIISFINLIIVIYYGLKPYKNDMYKNK